MLLQDQIKEIVKDKNTSKETKSTLRVLLGEFGRINDGKVITNEQCIIVIKKFIKNIDETLDHIKRISESFNPTLPNPIEKLTKERNLLLLFLPQSATIEQINDSIVKILKTNTFKNNMQSMKYIIDDLELQGLDVDKKLLSELIRKL